MTKPKPPKKSGSKTSWRPVYDLRGVKVRGLWQRGKRFAANMNVPDPVTGEIKTRRIPLEGKTAAQAGDELGKLKRERRAGTLKVITQSKGFSEFAEVYLATIKPTISVDSYNRRSSLLNTWKRYFGDKPLAKITAQNIRHCRNERLDSVGGRTVNLELNELRQVLNLALEQKLLVSNVSYQIKPLSAPPVEKRLLTKDEIPKLVAAALEMKNGRQLADFLLLATYTGARQKELLQLKWENINWQARSVHFEAQITKKKYARDVNFNPLLEAHLKEMYDRRKDDGFLFPSGRGERVKHYFHTIKALSRRAGIPFTGHLLRHYFISRLVMAGYDYKTIATWVGHKDGGVLIGKRYGHLSDSHLKAMADNVKCL